MTANYEQTYVDAYGASVTWSIAGHNPIMQANSNIFPPSPNMALGGVIRNPTIIVEGYANAAGDLPSGLIVTNSNNPNISVIGDPPWWDERLISSPLSGGYLSSPDVDTVSPSSHPGQGCSINMTGEGCIVDGVRCDGLSYGPRYGIFVQLASGLVQNCIYVDHTSAGASGTYPGISGSCTKTHNISYDDWVALGTIPGNIYGRPHPGRVITGTPVVPDDDPPGTPGMWTLRDVLKYRLLGQWPT
jgi:hypothetical protein